MTEADWLARREALYQSVGRAVHSSQMLETQLRLILATLKEELEVQIDFRSLAAPDNKEPLGKLIGALNSHGKPPATARAVLTEALQSRNRVVHQFFIRNADAFSHPTVFAAGARSCWLILTSCQPARRWRTTCCSNFAAHGESMRTR